MTNETSTPITLPDFKGMTQDQLLQVIDAITGLAEHGIGLIDSHPQGASAEYLKTVLRPIFGAIGYRGDTALTDVEPGVDLEMTWGLRAAV